MTTPFHCDDKERLVSYLYDEGGHDDRAAVHTHLATCAECREEVADLRSLRANLGRWQPPDADFTVRIVREPAARTWWHVPAWATAALAAGLVLALGAAIANVEVQVGGGTLVVRTGWAKSSPAVVPSAQHAAQAAASKSGAPARPTLASTGMPEAEVRKALNEIETRIRADLAATARPAAANVQRAAAGDMDKGQLLQQVRSLVDESERRQQRELALRLAQVVQDFDAQRRTDLVRIENGFGQIESLTGEEAARQRAITNYLVRASQRQQ
jgi:hypothetical protein